MKRIRTDHGTNFVGANNELRSELTRLASNGGGDPGDVVVEEH